MLFVEFRFFVFFALVFGIYWTLRGNTARKGFLLLCSHLFYACFFIGEPMEFLNHLRAGQWNLLPNGWWFPGVLIGSTCMDYLVGLGVENARDKAKRRAWLFVSLVINIGVLCYFKYFNFFIISASSFLNWIGLHASFHTLKIILPYGVSFYTFQSMSYTIEVYRRHRPAERNFLDLAFFIAFFPQLVAGPIVRAMTFLPQTKSARVWSDVAVRGALVLFMTGFVKKACVAEAVAPFVDQYFSAPEKFNALSAWIGVLLYAVQIYCDFSGYTDMAIATAKLLGYELTMNFKFPYFAQSVTDFWRRWHISLSTWLRDYLYISLGGNRGSRFFTYRNLFLTMLLGGLWHGAAWSFVIWGALHGGALIAHREWQRWRGTDRRKPQIEPSPLLQNDVEIANPRGFSLGSQNFQTLLATILTFYFVCLCWIFFRAGDLHKSMKICAAFVKWKSWGHSALDPRLLMLFGALAFVHWLNFRRVFSTWWRRAPDVLFAAGYGAAVALILLFIPQKYTPFIYFQF